MANYIFHTSTNHYVLLFRNKIKYFYTSIFTFTINLYSIYEIGYIENDILTTKKEKYPTIRLNLSIPDI